VDGVITVGAIDNNGSLLSYSNTGSSMDLVAPSGSTASLPFTLSNPYDGIRTTDRMGSSGFNSGNYTSFNGTSAACPQVSGVAALLLSVNSNLTESQVTDILQSTATDMGTTGFDNSFGYGRLNACAAVNKALATTLTIIGDAEVCTTSNAYTVSTLPSSYSVSWSITPSNIASVNSSTGVVTRTGDGWATLKATFSNGCFTDSLSKQIHIGTLEAPTQMYFNGTSYNASSYPCLPKLTEYEITIDPIYGASSYYWSIGGTGLIYVGGQGTNTINVIIGSSTGTSLTFAVQPENACGRGSGLTINGEVCGTGSEEAFRVSPNPATSNIQIQSIDKKTLIKEIRIVDKMSFVRKQLKYSVENTSISLYVGDLASDIYYIQIFDGKKWTTKAISKK
jgi:hypothetical protein